MSYENSPPEWRKYFGRIITIDPTKCRIFSCGGFSVNAHNHPVEIIQPNAQVNKILEGLHDGRLKDITESHKKGLGIEGSYDKGIGHTPTFSTDTGKRVYFTTTTDGGLAIKSAETPEEIDVCEDTIKRAGVIVPQDYKVEPPIGVEGRVMPGQESILLHGLNELVEKANSKVYGSTPIVKPGPIKTG